MDILKLISRLKSGEKLTRGEWRYILEHRSEPGAKEFLFRAARDVRCHFYGNKVFVRGLIEFTNYCKNDCYYCGIRRSNIHISRYRLTKRQILECCEKGYRIGLRTFVLQGGEDAYQTEERITDIIRTIKAQYPDCALTLSIGEKSPQAYLAYKKAGTDRYLLRHETANLRHYARLHPPELSLENRMACLYNLKEMGFQTGAGFMVGSPGQTLDCVIDDLEFLRRLQPEMVGIGPFLPHHDTPFAEEPAGTVELTITLLALIRLMLPKVLLPATTALGSAGKDGRQQGILAGANVVMPNLSPMEVRKKYLLYDNKAYTGDEAAEGLEKLKKSMEAIGYQVMVDRGDPCP